MPIKDSIYTSPDALRLLYLNPRNPLKETSDQNAPQPIVQPPPPDVPVIPSHCPAMTEYILACVGTLRPMPQPMPVRALREGMRLWNPIAKTFGIVEYAEVSENQDCVRLCTYSGAEVLTSISSRGIVNIDDREGRYLFDLIMQKDKRDGAVQWLMGQKNALDCTIEAIADAGKADVMHIMLEKVEGQVPIYATGSRPEKMLCWHNKPVNPGNTPNTPTN